MRCAEIQSLLKAYGQSHGPKLRHEDLLPAARHSLMRHGLSPHEVEDIAPFFARTMHMMMEQNGGVELDPALQRHLERDVLDWYRHEKAGHHHHITYDQHTHARS